MIVYDIWGSRTLDDKYVKLIETKEFSELEKKKQLGFIKNANHTRYDHSIGVLFLADKLISILENKYPYTSISQDDADAFKISALVHDLGHSSYSHAIERVLSNNHEEETLKILLNKNSEIYNEIIKNFNINVYHKVIKLISQKDSERKSGKDDILTILSPLLAGSIDIDRIDYITRDTNELLKEKNNYEVLLDYINLVYVDNNIKIAFDEKAEYIICDFLMKRFKMYDLYYSSNHIMILEKILHDFLIKTKFELKWDTNISELDKYIYETTYNSDPIIQRRAQLLYTKRLDSNILLKEFSDQNEYLNFISYLKLSVPHFDKLEESIVEEIRDISIYSKSGEILINKNNQIEDISKCSNLLDFSLMKNKNVYSIDLKIVTIILKKMNLENNEIKKILDRIKNIFSGNYVYKLKFDCESNDKNLLNKTLLAVKGVLNIEDVKEEKVIEKYYVDANNNLENNNISLTKTISDKTESFTITQLVENKVNCLVEKKMEFISFEDAITYIENNYVIKLTDLNIKFNVKLLKEKYMLKINDSLFEISFNKKAINFNDNLSYSLEIKFIEGELINFYFIEKELEKYNIFSKNVQSDMNINLSKVQKEYLKERSLNTI